MAETGKLRMMLVDDSSETREYLRKLLQFESHIQVVGMAANGRDAVKMALEVKPDLILMDINMPVMDGISAAEVIFRELPSVRVVMMSVQSEMAYLRRAMQVGAREFLIKPFTHDELLNILGEVSNLTPAPQQIVEASEISGVGAQQVHREKRATLVSVFSPRGGAGCSTLAINLAVALVGQRQARVLLVDGNLRFGAIDAMLNLQITRSISDVVSSLEDADGELLHSVTLPHTTGIRLLAAPPRPEEADLITAENLKRVIAIARQRYDYVVVDVGCRLDDKALSFLDAANCTFVLLTPDIPAIKNVRLFLEVAHDLEYDLDSIFLVLNRANPRGGINAEAIQRHLKLPIIAAVPNSPRVVQAAINRGVPLILYEREINKEMPVTRQLLTLVDRIPQPGEVDLEPATELETEGVPERVFATRSRQRERRKGFLGRIFGQGD
jgi:pilus assembly protein CpaE